MYRCYFPLFDKLGARRVTALNADYAPAGLEIPLHYPALVVKQAVWGSPLALKADDRRDPFRPLTDEQRHAIDIRPWLLQVWYDAELSEWIHHNATAELPIQPSSGDPLEVLVAKKQAELEKKKQREAEEREKLKENMAKLRAHVNGEADQQVERNGKGKH